MTRFALIVASRIVGIEQEGPLVLHDGVPEGFRMPEPFWGFATLGTSEPAGPQNWLVRIRRRFGKRLDAEELSCRFFHRGVPPTCLRNFPNAAIVIERGNEDLFANVCKSSRIEVSLHSYDGEININPRREQKAA